jgi:hypothetical protein
MAAAKATVRGRREHDLQPGPCSCIKMEPDLNCA